MALALGELIGEFRSVMSDLLAEMKAERLRNAERDEILRALIEALGGAAPEKKSTLSLVLPTPPRDDVCIGSEQALALARKQQKETPTG